MLSLLSPLKNSSFRGLFLCQILSLFGTGLASVALALQAYELNNTNAGLLLSAVLAVKMVAYVTLAPVAGLFAVQLPRRVWLLSLNIFRGLVVIILPWATEVWQLLTLIFILNAMAAGFTPVYQALLPELLNDEDQYNQALSLSRLMMEVEGFVSPVLAAVLLTFVSWPVLFELNALAFVLAALMVAITAIPVAPQSERSGSWTAKLSFGIRSYLKTPRLQAVMALQLALACAGAMVIVNTVVYVQQWLLMSAVDVPILMSAAGAGSMLAAFSLPKLLHTFSCKQLMLTGGSLFVVALGLGATLPSYNGMMAIWALIGISSALVMVPIGIVIRDSSHSQDRTEYFAANFSLSHLMWLVGYLLAGVTVSQWGLSVGFIIMAVLAGSASLYAWYLWPEDDRSQLWHEHPAVDHLHPHTHDEHHQHEHEGWEGPEPHVHPHYHPVQRHQHHFVIDEHHLHWPKQ